MPAEIFKPEIVTKPWGNEVIFAVESGRYAGKVITVDPGQALSCQYHHHKHETMYVLSGGMSLKVGRSMDELDEYYLYAGTAVKLPPGVIHLITAQAEGVVFVESSTAWVGWRDDVVRLEDRYGRAGTTAP